MPEVMFAGPDGRLEGRYHHAKQANAPVALVLHPHPLHGGTMNNRVVHALYQRFQAMGFSTLRFNFRGVGSSQGRYDGGIGEISDAARRARLPAGGEPERVLALGRGLQLRRPMSACRC